MTNSTRDHARILDPALIVKTVERLRARISERFPDSGLAAVAADLTETAQATAARVQNLSRPYLGLRLLALLAVIAGIAAQIYVARLIDWADVLRRADPVGITQGLDSIVNLLLLAFAAIWFVLTLEQRLKRRRVQRRLYELRSFAHVNRHASADQGPDCGAERQHPHAVLAGAADEQVRAVALSRLLR